MITIKIGKRIRIQKYLISGLKLFLLDNNKWICLKFNKNEKELLYYTIKLFREKTNHNYSFYCIKRNVNVLKNDLVKSECKKCNHYKFHWS